VMGQDGNIVQFKIKKHTALKKLMSTYCERAGLALQVAFSSSLILKLFANFFMEVKRTIFQWSSDDPVLIWRHKNQWERHTKGSRHGGRWHHWGLPAAVWWRLGWKGRCTVESLPCPLVMIVITKTFCKWLYIVTSVITCFEQLCILDNVKWCVFPLDNNNCIL